MGRVSEGECEIGRACGMRIVGMPELGGWGGRGIVDGDLENAYGEEEVVWYI